MSDSAKFVVAVTSLGFVKRTPLEEFRVSTRGGRGIVLNDVTEHTGSTVAVFVVSPEDQLIVAASTGMCIRFLVGDLRETGRNTQGVRAIMLDDGAKVVSACVVPT
jgi:DNA gyrase subunit A